MKIISRFIMAAMMLASCGIMSGYNYGRYEVRGSRVYYNGVEVHAAESAWFSDLGYGYAKDRNHVYLNGQILPYVDPSSFRVDRRYAPASGQNQGFDNECVEGWYNGGYVVAGVFVMYNGRVVNDAVAGYFKDLGWGYGKDAKNVYYCGVKLQGVQVYGFKVIKDGFAKNNYEVFYCGQKIHGASPSTFRLLSDGYSRDQHGVFYCAEKLHQADVATFRVLRKGYAADRRHAYYQGQIVK